MAYLDEDILYNNIEEKYKSAKGEARGAYSDVLDTICEMPRADVVPKSEVDLYKRLNDELEDELASTYDKLENAKAEVAREIFEEIEKIRAKEIHRCEVVRENEKDMSERKYWEGGEHALRQLSYWFAELKKKYTEGEK